MPETSRVISFRLNPDIDDERLALDILARYEESGVGVRQAIVGALLRLDGKQPSQRPVDLVDELRAALKESRALIDALRSVGIAPIQVHPESSPVRDEQPALDPSMRGAIKKAMRTGFKAPQV